VAGSWGTGAIEEEGAEGGLVAVVAFGPDLFEDLGGVGHGEAFASDVMVIDHFVDRDETAAAGG